MVLTMDRKTIEIALKFSESGTSKFTETAKKLKMFNIENQGFVKTMKMSLPEWQKFNQQGGKFNTMGGHLANGLRKMTHGMRGFKMEMLGVMFFGMTMYRTFTGLLKTSLEWMGVTELLSETLGILFLPVAELILDWALLFLDWVLQLTPAQKKLIGMFVLFGAVIGAVVMVFGTLALGIGSMILAFSWLLSPLGLVIAGFAALAGYFVFKQLFKENSDAVDNLKNSLVSFGVSGKAFDEIKNKAIEWFSILKDKFSGIKDKIGEWIGESLPKVIESGGNLIIGLADGISNNSEKIGESIRKLIGKLSTWISENISTIIDSGVKILDGIVKGISDNVDKISSVLETLLTAIGKWIVENSWMLIKLGLKIAGAILKGISQGILAGIDRILEKIPGYSKTRDFVNKFGPNYGVKPVEDFILQPGGRLIKTDPNDTIMGSKSGFGGVNMNVTYYVNVSDKRQFEEMLSENNRQLAEDVRRLIKV